MKKKIISTVLSMLSIICIGVCAPFSAFAEIDFEWDTKDGLQMIINTPDVASTLVNKLKETATTNTYTAPEMRFISGSRAIEYTSNGLNLRAWSVRVYCYYVSSDSVFKGLTFKDKATNRDLQVNNIYIDYVDNSGSIRHYCIKPNYLTFSLTWRGYCDLGYTGGYYNLDDGLDFPLDNYSHNFRLLSDFDINNYNQRVVVSSNDIKGVYYNNYQNPTFYPSFDSILYNAYLFRYGDTSQYYTSVYPDFFVDNFNTNVATDNNNIDNKDTGVYNYYYNTEFKQGDTYNFSDTEYKVERLENDINYKFKDIIPPIVTTNTGGGGWESPDYPTITGSAILNPSIVEFSTADIPSNLMQVGTSFLSESLKVVDVIPNFMLCIGIIFMVWVCFHIFGK